MCEVSVRDPQSQHVPVGACGDAKYLIASQMHPRLWDKVTYIKGSILDIGIQRTPVRNAALTCIFDTASTYEPERRLLRTPRDIPAGILAAGVYLDYQRVRHKTATASSPANTRCRMGSSVETASTSTP